MDDEPLFGDLAEIEAAAGREAARAIADNLPGRTLQIPGNSYAGPLSPVLAEIEGLIGRELTLRFARAFGGARVYIPGRNASPHGRVQSVIGHAATLKLAEGFGNLTISLPNGPERGPAAKARQIHKLLLDGASAGRIARECGVTERTAFNHRRRLIEAGVLPASDRRPPTNRERLIADIRAQLLDERPPTEVAEETGTDLSVVLHQQSYLRSKGLLAPKPNSFRRFAGGNR